MDGQSLGEIATRLHSLMSDPIWANANGIESPIDALCAMQRETTTFAAATVGVRADANAPAANRLTFPTAWRARRWIQDRIDKADAALLVIDPRPGLHIIDANHQYAAATMTRFRQMYGNRLFDVFPDNPADPVANGTYNLYNSLCQSAATGTSHRMPAQRYDVAGADGSFVERHWSPTNTAVYTEKGRLLYLVHQVEDITSQVLMSRRTDIS